MLLRAPTRSVLTSLAAVCAVGFTACAPMDPSGDPLAAVPVQASVRGGGGADASVAGSDNRFTDLAELKSEDLKVDPSEDSSGGGGPSVQVGSTMSPAATPAAATAEPVATASASAAASPAVVSGGTMAWPVRLVRTHLDEQPPSAVLAMPDGRRIVVSPGDMVPERGLVVMAIGRDRVQLAAINSRGDHATVVPMELTAQY